MTLYLVRHAQAGERRTWRGADVDRPLSGRGQRQAEAIADRLAGAGLRRLVSSPYRRCIETLEPLAGRVGLDVETDDRLAEGAAFEDALALLAELGDAVALSSHGDVIAEAVAALVRRGMEVVGPPDWRKASVWAISVDTDGSRQAESWPPPDRPHR